MAKRRMFTLQIVDSDAFLDMPATSQLLYFHLAMRADDEGFLGNPKKVMRMVGMQDDDIKILIAKRFILPFESGVIVIKHWLMHNSIRMDRFCPTAYQEEKQKLYLKDNKSYTDNEQYGNQKATKRQPKVAPSKDKLSKVKLTKYNINKEKLISDEQKTEIIRFFEEKGADKDLIEMEINKFISYWTEKNHSGTKERWQLEKTFEVKKRLSTWFLNVNKFRGQNVQRGVRL